MRSVLIAPLLLLALLCGATERDRAGSDDYRRGISSAQLSSDAQQLPFLASGNGLALDATARVSGSAPHSRNTTHTGAAWSTGERIALPQALASALRCLAYARTLLDSRSGLPLTYGTPPPRTLS